MKEIKKDDIKSLSDTEIQIKNLKIEGKCLSDTEKNRNYDVFAEKKKKYTKKISKIRENPKKEAVIELDTIFQELNISKMKEDLDTNKNNRLNM